MTNVACWAVTTCDQQFIDPNGRLNRMVPAGTPVAAIRREDQGDGPAKPNDIIYLRIMSGELKGYESAWEASLDTCLDFGYLRISPLHLLALAEELEDDAI